MWQRSNRNYIENFDAYTLYYSTSDKKLILRKIYEIAINYAEF